MHTMPSERRSPRRAFARHGAGSSFADEPAYETMCDAPCHRRVSEWSGRLRCIPPTRGMALLTRVGRGKGENMCASIEEKKHRRVVCTTCGAAAAPPALELHGITMFSYRFCSAKHINLLDMESLISLFRCVTREGMRAQRLPGTCGFTRSFGSRLKRRSSPRKLNFLLRRLGFWCFAFDIALELVWVTTWTNPADAPSRNNPIESWHALLPASASTDSGLPVSPRSLGAGTAP